MRKTKLLLMMLAMLLTAVTGARADGIVCSVNDIGKVLCTNGSIYKTLSQAETSGQTPVAMIAYVKDGEGLAIALHPIEKVGDYYYGKWTVPLTYDTSGEYNEGKTAKQWAEEWNTTTPVTNATWRLPSSTDWENMIQGCGGEPFNYDDIYVDEWDQWVSSFRNPGNIDIMLQALSPEITITSYENLVSGDWESSYGMGVDCSYWTSTISDIVPGVPFDISFSRADDSYYYSIGLNYVDWPSFVRPCLAFDAIDPNPVTELTLDKSSASVMVGEAVKLTATITPEDASDKRVVWSSEDSKVLFFADEDCTIKTGGLTDLLTVYVQGQAAGLTTVTVTSYSDATLSASCEVTVNNPAITLSEQDNNSEFIKNHKGQTYDVTLNRTLKAGGWNTFSMPFSISHDQMLSIFGENVKIKMLRNSGLSEGNLSLSFADGWSINAGYPYLLKVESDIVNPVFENVVISDATITFETPHADFIPVINPLTLTEGAKTNLFVYFGNKLTYPVGGSTIKGFRAYFHVKGEAVGAREFIMEFDDEPTSITSIENGQSTNENAVYNLAGQRVDKAGKSGLYIMNGKKVVIK